MTKKSENSALRTTETTSTEGSPADEMQHYLGGLEAARAVAHGKSGSLSRSGRTHLGIQVAMMGLSNHSAPAAAGLSHRRGADGLKDEWTWRPAPTGDEAMNPSTI